MARRRGNHEQATALLAEGLARQRELGDTNGIATALHELGLNAQARGQSGQAEAYHRESLSLRREIGDKPGLAACLDGLAEIAVAHGQVAHAARLLSAAAATRASTNFALPPADQTRHDRLVAAARAGLGAEAFAAAWTAGASPTQVTPSPLDGPSASPAPTPPATAAPISSTPPGELSPREIDVLRLVTRGLTNAQVAAQLSVSTLTVNAHLRSIYSKLGVTSRAAATRYAMEHRLA